MKKFNKILSLVLVLAMMLSLVACGGKTDAPATTAPAQTEAADQTEAVVYSDPFADVADDYDELSQAVYDHVLGDFYTYYMEAQEETSTAMRYAKMAIAEAKMLGAGIFLPTTSKGGYYAISRMAPKSNTPVLWGNDTYRMHDVIVAEELIASEDIAAMRAEWVNKVGTGEYEQFVKDYMTEKGYTLKDHLNYYFDADPETWDVLATSNAADSEILVNTYDGLVEYDMENQLQPALAESWEVSEDGLTYTFKIRQGQVWVDNQGRKVADVKADDFVAGMQHMMDAMGGLEYLVCAGCANIVGADEYVNGETTDFATVGVKAVDEYTLQYTLTQPTAYFMTMLGYGVFAPMSREYYESMGGKFGAEYDTTVDSYKYGFGPDSIAYCGPFLVENFTSKNIIAFTTNESYWNVEGNNVKTMNYYYQDGSDPTKMYNDTLAGNNDGCGLNANSLEVAKNDGNYDKFGHVSETDATSYCGFFNVRRAAFANYNDANVGQTPKTESDLERTGAAMLNQNFRLALAMSIDRATYNAQSVGEDLKLNSLINTYTPGTFVNLPEEVTVDINGTATTFAAGTFYGAIMQAQLDADGVALKVWNGESSSGFDGWYNPDAAAAALAKAVEELAAVGIEVSAENPIYIDFPVRTDSQTNVNMKQSVKQSVETVSGGLIKINLVEYATRDHYLDATYWYTTGSEANFDMNDGSGWGPDYGDPSTYLGTMLPQYAGYMTKSLGIF